MKPPILIICTALALAAAGCSSQRHSTVQSTTHDSHVARIGSRDSIFLIATAIIDSPEIVLESPALPGGRSMVRGRRLRAEACGMAGSQTEIAIFQEHTDTISATADKRRPAPAWPGRMQGIIIAATAIIFFILGRKNAKKS